MSCELYLALWSLYLAVKILTISYYVIKTKLHKRSQHPLLEPISGQGVMSTITQ